MLRHRRVYVRVVNQHIIGKHLVSGVFRDPLYFSLPWQRGLQEDVRLLCRLSQGRAVGGSDLRRLRLGGGKDGPRSVRECLSAATAHPLWCPCSLPCLFRRWRLQYRHSAKNRRDLLPRLKTWSTKEVRMILSGSSGTGQRGKCYINLCLASELH